MKDDLNINPINKNPANRIVGGRFLANGTKMNKYSQGWRQLNGEKGDAKIGAVGVLAVIFLLLAYAWLFRLFLILGCSVEGNCVLY